MEKDKIYGYWLRRINAALDAEANRNLSKRDLTRSQAHFLMELLAFPEHTATLKEMEARMHVTQPTLAGIVARMEKKGLLTVFPDANDKRAKRVRLTEKGRENCAISEQEIAAVNNRLVSGLTECEKTLLANLLERICDTINDPASAG